MIFNTVKNCLRNALLTIVKRKYISAQSATRGICHALKSQQHVQMTEVNTCLASSKLFMNAMNDLSHEFDLLVHDQGS